MSGSFTLAAAALQRDGAICLPGIIPTQELGLLETCFDWSLAHKSDNANDFAATESHPGRFYADINNPLIPLGGTPYDDLLLHSQLSEALSQMWQSDHVWFLYEQVLLKEGAAARRTPWHQDSSYLPIVGDMLAVMWLPLDPLPAAHALEFVQGSHRGPLYNGSAFDPSDDTAPIFSDAQMPRLPNIEAERDHWPILHWDVMPGDALVFHPATLHGGAPTLDQMRRRTLSLRFFGDDARYQPLPANGVRGIGIEGDTIWDKLASCLQPGDSLRHPDFLRCI